LSCDDLLRGPDSSPVKTLIAVYHIIQACDITARVQATAFLNSTCLSKTYSAEHARFGY
jgi:hypothetical protein